MALFYFRRSAGGGRCPAADEIDRFRGLWTAFAASAPGDWQAGLAEIGRSIEVLAGACEAGDRFAASKAIERLFRLRDKYHQLFKA